MNSTRKSYAAIAVVGCAAVATIVALTYSEQPSVAFGSNFLESSIMDQTSIKSSKPAPPFTLDPRYANYMSTFGKNYTTQQETAQR